MLSAAVPPPQSHDLRVLPSSSKFLPPPYLPDLAAAAAAVVLDPATSTIATVVAAATDADAMVPPAFRSFGHVVVVRSVTNIFLAAT